MNLIKSINTSWELVPNSVYLKTTKLFLFYLLSFNNKVDSLYYKDFYLNQ